MKRIAYYLTSLFVLVISILSVIPAGSASAVTSKADYLKAACGDGTPTSSVHSGNGFDSNDKPLSDAEAKQAYAACKKGFDAALESAALAPTKTTLDVCYKTLYPGMGKKFSNNTTEAGYCEIGYVAAYPNRDKITKAPATTPKTPSQTADPDAVAACNDSTKFGGGSNDSDLRKTCQEGWAGAKAGKSKSATCSAGSSANIVACETGWDLYTATQTTGSGANEQLDCDTTFNNPLSWILCPLIDTLASVIDGLDHIITSYLEIDTDSIFGSSSDTYQAYHDVWQQFRNIALGMMIIAGLIIVISQALGFEFLDAYTIRKTLPRLLIAAIGISISWPLMHFLIDASNWLGFGIRRLIYYPFTQGDLKTTIDLNFGGGIWNILGGGGTAVAGAAAGGIWLLLGGIGVVLSYAATGALAVMIAILVLVLRQIAIIFLLLIAPLAIIMYALPNTEKYYKFWWESFSKALLMFPLIAAFIAVGRVFAAVSFHNTGGGGIQAAISQLIGFIAYFAPYFLIPLTFRFAGGFVRQLGGFVNDRGKGAFDRLRKGRQGAYQSNAAKLKAGTRLEGKSWIPGSIKAAGAVNRVSKGVGTGWNGRYGLGPRGRLAMANVNQAAAAEAAKEEGMQAVSGWNDVNRVLAYGMGDQRRGYNHLVNWLQTGGDDGKTFLSEGAARERADTALRAAKVAGSFDQAHGIAAFMAMARDGTAIRDADDLATLAAMAGQGDKNNTFKYAAEAASVSRQVGRSDIAVATEPIGELAFQHSDELFNGGQKVLSDPKTSMSQASFAAWKSGAGGEVAYTKFSTAKGRTIRNDTKSAVDILKAHKRAIESGRKSDYSDDQVQFAAATLVEAQSAIDQNYGKINNRLDAANEMSKDEGALQWYLDTGTKVKETVQVGSNPYDRTPVYESRERGTTNREVVQKMVGDRYASMSPEQRKIAEQNKGNEDADKNK